ncbi:hypothetical protein M9Y10_045304 [Tritrichomonas musculus]|uniref:Uncharacterized protein n=1 Tax=Tritrichomonas musculus TaxID=1915356 RepID=A0ABR2JWQ6_9EUKA
MLSYHIQHSLSDIIGIPLQDDKIMKSINISKSENVFDLVINPKKCFCSNISKDGYSIVYQRTDSQITFYQFTFYPPISRKLYEGSFETNNRITESFLSSNNRLFSFTTSLEQVTVVDLMRSPTSNYSSIFFFKNIQHFIPILSTSHHTYYIFEKSQILYYAPITYGLNMTNSILSKNNTMIIKNAEWWAIDSQTLHIAVLTTKKRLHIYIFNGKATEVFSSYFPSFIPTNFFVTSKSIFVLISVEPNQISFFTSSESGQICSYQFTKKFSFSDLNTTFFDSLILVSISKIELLLYDIEDNSISIINDPEIIDFQGPPTLTSCSSSWNLFFDVDSLAFYRLDINFKMLTKLFSNNLTLVAHLIGGHPPFSTESEMIILAALSNLNNFDFYSFLLEYIISATYNVLKQKSPALYLRYIPHSNKKYPHYQIIHEPGAKNQNEYEQSIQNDDQKRIFELKNENELKQLILPLYSQNEFNKWICHDKLYSPCGFWRQSTILFSLYLIIHSKQPKNKLPYPLNEFDTLYPITFYNPTFEEKKQMKDLSFKSVKSFVSNFMEISREISDNLVIPTDHMSQLFLLLTHYVISKKYHFPYHIEKLRVIQKLAITYYSKTTCFILSSLGLFQFFDILNFEGDHLDDEIMLWINSNNISSNISPQLIEGKCQNWPMIYFLHEKIISENEKDKKDDEGKKLKEDDNKRKENIYHPFIIYENEVSANEKDDLIYKKILKLENEYSFDNLLSLYS